MVEQAGGADYGELMKKVEKLVGALEGADDIGSTIKTIAEGVIAEFRDELGIFGGRLYRREGNDYRLLATFPGGQPVTDRLLVPVTYAAIDALLDEGAIFMDRDDPRLDRGVEDRLGVERFAAIEVGDEDFDYLLAFDVAEGHDRASILHSLGILRHSINHKIRQERMMDVLWQARRIQASILPRRPPDFSAFDIHGRSEPLEIVGGDFFDFLPITDKILGLAIADVSGHGLPAALQVRDVYTGLRMGMARDFKIVRTVERLNGIIHESTLTSRFVSMFYGELDANGVFIYVNAGHPAPYHLPPEGAARALTEGGAVLGPIPETTYERGYLKLEPGSLLVLATDGILETMGAAAPGDREEYGARRLIAAVARHRDDSAAEIVDAVFADVDDFCGHRAARDDRTVVVVRYPVT